MQLAYSWPGIHAEWGKPSDGHLEEIAEAVRDFHELPRADLICMTRCRFVFSATVLIVFSINESKLSNGHGIVSCPFASWLTWNILMLWSAHSPLEFRHVNHETILTSMSWVSWCTLVSGISSCFVQSAGHSCQARETFWHIPRRDSRVCKEHSWQNHPTQIWFGSLAPVLISKKCWLQDLRQWYALSPPEKHSLEFETSYTSWRRVI